MAATVASTSTTLIGKRKRPSTLVLHISASEDSDAEGPSAAQARKQRAFACTHVGCTKAYTKPSRLEEHARSHTGERPYVCSTCQKSYLRESHLQAHSRTHLPASSRLYACSYGDCDKRFWTAQHLRVHTDTHQTENAFRCSEADCDESFAKQYQLRSHICTAHAPAGTKPYICTHPGCTKSFSTNQKLTAHSKVHEAKRYTCVHEACVSANHPAFYPNWSTLQNHIRTAHPPACPYASCNGRTFTQQKGLRAHLKLHEQREAEAALMPGVVDEDEDAAASRTPRKRRRGGEYGRDWTCEVAGCTKDFKSKQALATHHSVFHLGRRDFLCIQPGCGQAFGYKHLLQRHAAKAHALQSESDPAPEEEDEQSDGEDESTSAIDGITGKAYAARSTNPRAMRCPHPCSAFGGTLLEHDPEPCDYWFTRAYDLRRHLAATHRVDVDKDTVDRWVVRSRG